MLSFVISYYCSKFDSFEAMQIAEDDDAGWDRNQKRENRIEKHL